MDEGAVPPAEPAPAYAPPPPPQRRSSRSLLVIAGAILLVVLLVIAYVAIGLVTAQAKITKAESAYNTVASHQNSLNDTVRSLASNFPTQNVTAETSADLQSAKTTMDQIVNRSRQAQPQIRSDDAALAAAQSGLTQDQWLTAISRSRLDRASNRITHERAALAKARTITDDYVAIGAFFDAYIDMALDFDTLTTKAQASDFAGAAAANEKAKADVAKAIQLDKAPGLPDEMDALLKDIQAVTTDISNVLNAAAKGDAAALDAANAQGKADSDKLQAFDFTAMGNKIDSYYQSLVDAYNSEVDKANKA